MLQWVTYIFEFFYFFHSMQGEACKDKIVPGKTQSSFSLCGVRLRAVLVTFGFLENIRHFSKYHHMDPKFPGNGDFLNSKIFV